MYIDTYLRNLSTHYLAVTDTVRMGDEGDERYAHDHARMLAEAAEHVTMKSASATHRDVSLFGIGCEKGTDLSEFFSMSSKECGGDSSCERREG